MQYPWIKATLCAHSTSPPDFCGVTYAPSISAYPSSSPVPSLTPTSPPSMMNCDENEYKFEMGLVPDDYPEETTWTLENMCTDEKLLDVTATGAGKCIDNSQQYKFTIYDDYGDGICCEVGEGSYSISLDDELITKPNNGAFGSEDSVVFGPSCPSEAPITVKGSLYVPFNGFCLRIRMLPKAYLAANQNDPNCLYWPSESTVTPPNNYRPKIRRVSKFDKRVGNTLYFKNLNNKKLWSGTIELINDNAYSVPTLTGEKVDGKDREFSLEISLQSMD